nr:RloB domain-containing protein [Clostridia bacterium]
MHDRRYYYLALEGMTELMYFERLRDIINASALHPYKVELICAVEHSPMRAYKRLKSKAAENGEEAPVFRYVRDMENPSERQAFHSALREMKHCGMELYYSNYTFELWLLMHKCRFAESIADKRNYLKYINRYFGTSYG